MSFDFTTLITDRTQADVAAAKDLMGRITRGTATEADLAVWNGAALRGAYNYTDLNRVGAAVNALAETLAEHGYFPRCRLRTDWTESEWMEPNTAAEYLAAVAEIRSQFAQMSTTPVGPEQLLPLGVAKANAIEQILVDAERVLRTSLAAQVASAQVLVFSGFAVYPQGTEDVFDTNGMAATQDRQAVYTADGYLVYLGGNV